MTEQEAFNEGYDAFEMGWRRRDCPPWASAVLRSEWDLGWKAAESDLLRTEQEAMEAFHDEQDLMTLFNER